MQFFMCTVSVLYFAFVLKIDTLLAKRIEMYILFITVSKWTVQYNVVWAVSLWTSEQIFFVPY